jgi:hypothetical protein
MLILSSRKFQSNTLQPSLLTMDFEMLYSVHIAAHLHVESLCGANEPEVLVVGVRIDDAPTVETAGKASTH